MAPVWADERLDVPSVLEQDRPTYQAWLNDIGPFPPGQWEAITRHWISFLSATSPQPNPALAPNRKKVRWGQGNKSQDQLDRERFADDREVRLSIQASIWRHFDGLEALTERWPPLARLILNQVADPSAVQPFQTWAAKAHLPIRRRFDAVWTAMVAFLVHAYDEDGTLEEMGLHLSQQLQDDIMSIMEMQVREWMVGSSFQPEVEKAIQEFCQHMITDPTCTKRTNPLLWWTVVLVQSALSADDDKISRGRFLDNILPMDIDIRTRIQAVQHHAKVLVLDDAFHRWQPKSGDHLRTVQEQLNLIDNTWLNASDDQRPADDYDRRDCRTPSWQDVLAFLETHAQLYLGAQGGTALTEVRKLLVS